MNEDNEMKVGCNVYQFTQLYLRRELLPQDLVVYIAEILHVRI